MFVRCIMKIEIPSNYKKTNGGMAPRSSAWDPVYYLTYKSVGDGRGVINRLLDHCETFVDRKTKERIFVSHKYDIEDADVAQARKLLGELGVMMEIFEDSWYHEDTKRIEFRKASIHNAIETGECAKVLRFGKKNILICH